VLTNPTLAAIATLYTFAVFALLEFGVERKLYPRERYGSVLVLLITLVMVEALGMIGLLIAPPIAAAIQIALTEWLRPAPVVTEATSQDVSIAALKTRLAEAQTKLNQLEQPSPRTQNLMTRLNELIEKAESDLV
jgi:putative permease